MKNSNLPVLLDILADSIPNLPITTHARAPDRHTRTANQVLDSDDHRCLHEPAALKRPSKEVSVNSRRPIQFLVSVVVLGSAALAAPNVRPSKPTLDVGDVDQATVSPWQQVLEPECYARVKRNGRELIVRVPCNLPAPGTRRDIVSRSAEAMDGMLEPTRFA